MYFDTEINKKLIKKILNLFINVFFSESLLPINKKR